MLLEVISCNASNNIVTEHCSKGFAFCLYAIQWQAMGTTGWPSVMLVRLSQANYNEIIVESELSTESKSFIGDCSLQRLSTEYHY